MPVRIPTRKRTGFGQQACGAALLPEAQVPPVGRIYSRVAALVTSLHNKLVVGQGIAKGAKHADKDSEEKAEEARHAARWHRGSLRGLAALRGSWRHGLVTLDENNARSSEVAHQPLGRGHRVVDRGGS